MARGQGHEECICVCEGAVCVFVCMCEEECELMCIHVCTNVVCVCVVQQEPEVLDLPLAGRSEARPCFHREDSVLCWKSFTPKQTNENSGRLLSTLGSSRLEYTQIEKAKAP